MVVTHPALTSGYCYNCGAMGGCECNDGLKMRAYQNMKKAESMTDRLVDVEPAAAVPGAFAR